MKRITLITLIALAMVGLFALSATAGRPPAMAGEVMLTANQLYEAGQFAQAAQAYQQLIDQGVADSALYYNLGNAYFRQGDYGRAILNYRRAGQLAPRDADIQANLTLARGQALARSQAVVHDRGTDRSEGTGGGLPSRLAEGLLGRLTFDELAMVALGAWILFVFLLILFGSARAGVAGRRGLWYTGLRYALVVTAVVLVVGVLALGSVLYVENDRSEGVIVAAEVDVTSGPGAQYVAGFTLHSGAEVDLLEARGSWVRLALPGGELEGWVPASAVEAVTG